MSQIPSNSTKDKLTNALNGSYIFDIKSLFSQGWELGKRNMPSILLASVVTFAVAVFVAMAMISWFEVEDPRHIPQDAQLMLDITLALLTAPLITGVMMMGVNASVGKQVKAVDLFDFMSIAIWLSIGSLMISVFVQIGLLLFIIPGLYVAMASSFTLVIIAEKGSRPSQALILSIKVVNRYLLGFIKLYAVFAILFIASALTMGIGLIWTIPLYYNVKGVLYRDLFGVTTEQPVQGDDSRDESLFKA